MSTAAHRRRILVPLACAIVLALVALAVWRRPSNESSVTTARPGDAAGCTLGGGPGGLVAFDAATGTPMWKRPTGAYATTPPVTSTADDVIVLSTPGGASAGVNVRDGSIASCRGDASASSPSEHSASAAAVTEGPPTVDPTGLIHEVEYADNRQQIRVGVQDTASGVDQWRALVPGYHADLVGDLVVVGDQTGGTGDATALTADNPTVHDTLTAYAKADGHEVWQVDLPGVSGGVFEAGGVLATQTGRSAVTALNPTTGAILWTSDAGSPGAGGDYPEPGTYKWIGGDENTVVGLIVAEAPHGD